MSHRMKNWLYDLVYLNRPLLWLGRKLGRI